MACRPLPAAIMRAVKPMAPRRSTLAPRCSSSFATRSCPIGAAMCSSPSPSSSSASTCPPCCSHSITSCRSPCAAARPISSGSRTGAGLTEGKAAETSPSSCRFAGLSSTAPASPSTATAYRPLAASKRPATPHRPLSSGRAWRPPMRTRWPERLGVGATTVAGGAAACCRSSLAMAAWPCISASCSAVMPSRPHSSMLAPASSSSCTHSSLPLTAACIRAVHPSASCRSMLALCSSSRRTVASWPIVAATMRAVPPPAPRRSTLAPRCSSSFATCRCPPAAAPCSSPRSPSSRASTCPPCSSHPSTCCSSPRYVARPISSGSTMVTLVGGVAACCRSISAMAAWPSSSANVGAVWPRWSRSSVLAPAASSSCTHSFWPSLAAIIRAVHARPVLEQQAYHGVLASSRSQHESGAVHGTAQVDTGTALQQLLRHAQLPTFRGRVQQPAPVPVSTLSRHPDILRRRLAQRAVTGGGHLLLRRSGSGDSGGRHCRGLSHILQVRRLEQHRLRLALHRHRVPTLGGVEAPRHAAPPVELGPRLEAIDAHAAAREVGRGDGSSGGRRGGVLPEQLGDGGVATLFGNMLRREAEMVAQFGAGARLQQLLHALLLALASGHHQGGRPLSVLQVDARLVLEQQAHHGVLTFRRCHHESGAVHGTAQVDAGTALQQLLRHAQAPTQRGCVQQPVPVLVSRVHVPTLLQPLDHLLQLAMVRGAAYLFCQCQRGSGGGGGRLGGVLPEQLGHGGVALHLGRHQRRAAVHVAQLGAGTRR
eukprot:scaffold74268_cov74-Phaeocystis_antarctica.AAC.3